MLADRFGYSTRSGAVYGSECQYVILKEVKNQCGSQNVDIDIDGKIKNFTPVAKSTLFDARAQMRIKSVHDNDEVIRKKHLPIRSFFFDGKKIKSTTNGRKSEHTVEHIAILLEPGTQFLGHILPTDGTGITIFEAIVDFFEKKKTLI